MHGSNIFEMIFSIIFRVFQTFSRGFAFFQSGRRKKNRGRRIKPIGSWRLANNFQGWIIPPPLHNGLFSFELLFSVHPSCLVSPEGQPWFGLRSRNFWGVASHNWLTTTSFVSLVFFNFDLISNAAFSLSRIFCAPILEVFGDLCASAPALSDCVLWRSSAQATL